MKKSTSQEVACPHCRATQTEPVGAISTNCRTCGRYFKLSAASKPAEARGTRAPKATREVFCIKCGAANLVPPAALSTQCIRCSHYLEMGDKIVRGVQTGRIHAYDDVIFEEGCSFKGMEATGRNMQVKGKVFSKLRATEEIVALAGSNISGELHAPVVRIERGATVRVQELACGRLLVSGAVEITGLLTAGEIVLNDGAVFSGRLQVPSSKLTIAEGAAVQFDHITCAELAVEGKATLGTALSAERVAVTKSGTLISPVIRAQQVEVSAGGLMQAKIEKYVPPEMAKRPEPARPTEPQSPVEPEAQVA
jgi:cytoskeletal protein CcmA (bactofilin family)